MGITALITDVHANRQALEAVLEHAAARGATAYAFLGDLVGYGGDPGWVVDTIAAQVEAGAAAVLGNHDEAVVKGSTAQMHEDARAALDWTRRQLSPRQLDFLAALPLNQRRGDCLFVHANAYDPAGWDYVQGRMEAMRSLHATDAVYTFCGHMHEPKLYHLSGTGKAGDFTPQPGIAIPLLSHRQWLAIPGSCGQPRDGNPAACYALFDAAAGELSFERVPYDIEAAAARIRAAGLPERLAQRLTEGR
ncbi:metallophosphoesterase family protein [Roseateles violae]|uniref:Metallophosphoesterase family protein n=1 Tax=Roseateles violae TaxID=3058042 RepID=A0ABT8DX83_9BURK|nr:metallophosphoesterase family protein [Pelomonas sp. PFR6]MDN3921943.1 metallophosphoesterase family protein [Pelomonas sp. PFR6]